MTDKIDLNAPVSQAEFQERLSKLTPEELKNARQQQVDNAILNPKSQDDVDWARLSDSDFLKERMKRLGW
jgi:hypothetical protein